jgi:hypothetical protein
MLAFESSFLQVNLLTHLNKISVSPTESNSMIARGYQVWGKSTTTNY